MPVKSMQVLNILLTQTKILQNLKSIEKRPEAVLPAHTWGRYKEIQLESELRILHITFGRKNRTITK